MQLNLFDTIEKNNSVKISLLELFEAYFICRKNKRNTANALAFEVDYEKNLIGLWREINTGTYKPKRSIAFILDKPVKREIFAADFRDRIVHHLIIKKINPLFEKQFINDNYACRVGKGTHFGILRADRFIRRCSSNYTRDCYILKLDIKDFFMQINRNLLNERLSNFIEQKYKAEDKYKIIALCRKIIFNDPIQNCVKKSSQKKWAGLPESKSLFYSSEDFGLPIGNLTSQVFANFYMDLFDHFIKHKLKIKYYGRYVDDFIIVHQNKEYLKNLVPDIRDFLRNELYLTLHPKKIYLQHYTKGVRYLGAIIKPNRIYIANRTKGNFYESIEKHNQIASDHKPMREELGKFQSSMNSYLGIMKHYKTFKLRKQMIIRYVSLFWLNYVYINLEYKKFTLKNKKAWNLTDDISIRGFK